MALRRVARLVLLAYVPPAVEDPPERGRVGRVGRVDRVVEAIVEGNSFVAAVGEDSTLLRGERRRSNPVWFLVGGGALSLMGQSAAERL